MEDGLFYSETGLLNRILFYSDHNDINVFVEDEYKEYIYENIFERMFQSEVSVNKIFPMRGKKGVEKAFKEYGEQYDNKPAIYIVDGDFDIIMEREIINNSHYIYLEKYNIESYYVEEKAVLKYMAGKMKQSQKEIKQKIEYLSWEEITYDALLRLFFNYLVAQFSFPEEKNVGISPHIYFYDDGYVNEHKINEYENALKKRIKNYEDIYNMFVEKYELLLSKDSTRLICGKYLLASLAKYLRKKTGTNFKEEDFVYYLVTVFNIKKLDFIKKRILKLI